MAIQWNNLKNKIKNFLENGKNDKNRTISKVSKRIENFYISEIMLNATDPFQNKILNINTSDGIGLHKSLMNGFNFTFNNNSYVQLNQKGMSGVLQHWIGGQMLFSNPGPGMSTGVNNTIVDPGQIFSMDISNVSKENDIFSKELIRVLQLHSTTIKGNLTGVSPTGSPISIPWVGIL